MSAAPAEPLVSIATPVYNGEAFLRQCIQSVVDQSYQNWRYIIIDNASTDGSAAIAAEFARLDPRISVVRNPQLVPMVRNFNIAFSAAAAAGPKYTKLLMADDWLRPEFTRRMVDALEQNPKVGLACCWAFDGKKVAFDGWPYPAARVDGASVARAHLFQFRDLYVLGSPTTQLLRMSEVRDPEAFFNEENIIACDFEAGMRMLKSADFSFVHDVLAFARMHEESWTSGTSQMEGGFAGAAYTVLKCAPLFLSEQEQSAVREEVFSDYYGILAKHAARLPGKKFWRFHEDQFRRMGLSIDKWRVVSTAAPGIFNRLADPLQFWTGIVKRVGALILRKRRKARPQSAV